MNFVLDSVNESLYTLLFYQHNRIVLRFKGRYEQSIPYRPRLDVLCSSTVPLFVSRFRA